MGFRYIFAPEKKKDVSDPWLPVQMGGKPAALYVIDAQRERNPNIHSLHTGEFRMGQIPGNGRAKRPQPSPSLFLLLLPTFGPAKALLPRPNRAPTALQEQGTTDSGGRQSHPLPSPGGEMAVTGSP